MDSQDPMAFLQEHINKSIDAKLIPVIQGSVTGIEVAIVHIFNCLDRKGVLTLEDAEKSLRETREFLPEGTSKLASIVLRQIEQGLTDLQKSRQARLAASPESLRCQFRVIPGGLPEDPQKTGD